MVLLFWYHFVHVVLERVCERVFFIPRIPYIAVLLICICYLYLSLQYFDAVVWAAGRASGL